MSETEVWYGSQCEARIGLMADAKTDPTKWHYLEYSSLTITPSQDRQERALMGRPTENKLDPIKSRKGFFKLAAELKIDADSRGLPLALMAAFGAPATTGPTSELYTHVWKSGVLAANYFALQIKTGADEVRIYRGLTGKAISIEGNGDNVSDFDISISLSGLTRAKTAAFSGDAPDAIFAQSPAQRVLFMANGEAAENIISATWQWEREIKEGAYLSQTPSLSALNPERGGSHTGQMQVRGIGASFDAIEEGDTVFKAAMQFVGMDTGHVILFEHPCAMLNPAAIAINGPGAIERTFGWTAHQDETNPATRITVTNDVAGYAL